MRLFALLALLTAAGHAAVPAADLDRARSLFRERKLPEAEAASQALVAAHPREAEAHALLGAVLMVKQDPEAAVKAYEKAAELEPASSERQRQLGDAYGFSAQKAGLMSKLGYAKKCRTAYEKAVELNPQDLNARVSLLNFYAAAPGLVGGGIDKAYAQAAAIKRIDAARGHVLYAQLYSNEKKYPAAFDELEAALRHHPDDYTLLFLIGRLAAISGERIDRGMETLGKALTLTPPAGAAPHEAAHWRLGLLWEKKGDRPAARAAYETALKLNPNFRQAAEALQQLGAG